MKHSEVVRTITKLKGKEPAQQQIADILGLTRNAISSRAFRDKEYSYSEVEKIENFYKISFTNQAYIDDLNEKNDCITIDYYPETFGSCGNGRFIPAEWKERIEVSKRCIHDYHPFKHYSVVNACGDSMQPYIQDKDLLIFEDYDGEQIRDNRIYIFRYEDKIFVKRLALNINQLVIKSDNTEYQPITIELNENTDIQIIGKFAGLMRSAV